MHHRGPRRALCLLTILLALSFASAGGSAAAEDADAEGNPPGPPLPPGWDSSADGGSGGGEPAGGEPACDEPAGADGISGGPAEEVNHYNGTGNPTANITTSMGTIKIELYVNLVPVTANNFITLASSGFFNGIYFHRVIDDFVMQGGDPNTLNANPCDDGWGGSSNTIPLEIHDNLTHVDGAVGMARSTDPDSASSQFYICDGPQNNLDGDYAVFALVIEGIDIVRSICAVDTYPQYRPCYGDHPVTEVTITGIDIEEGWTIPAEDEGGGGDGKDSGRGASAVPGPGGALVLLAAAGSALVLGRHRAGRFINEMNPPGKGKGGKR